jgi:hypothetical protein
MSFEGRENSQSRQCRGDASSAGVMRQLAVYSRESCTYFALSM